MIGRLDSSRSFTGRVGRRLAPLAAALALVACSHAIPAPAAESHVEWLRARSMLASADELAQRYSGRGELWRHPYARPQPRAAAAKASVWFTAYPAATVTRPGESVLEALGNPELWQVFGELGIKAMHTGPMKLSGGVTGQSFTPTVDGNFDRISVKIDPAFGTKVQYQTMVENARKQGGIIIADVIPGHTGKGADFRLAEQGFRDYPGIYHMVEIDERDWSLLPSVLADHDSVNLSVSAVDALKAKGYIVGRLPRVIFYEPGVKETNWSATDVVTGVDGKKRRWVYLHYFKDGQPTLNWLDPSFAAQRLVIGDAIHALKTLGVGMLRLDANGFLGIEVGPAGGPAWSEGHPLSVTSNQLIAGMVRKLGGFTFQELNLTLEDIKAMSQGGADLSYDFVTRPAYHHALVTGDAEFLRLMLRLMHQYQIDPASLIHALQNHDELTLELVHFWTSHKADAFTFRGKEMTGAALRDLVRQEMSDRLIGPKTPYNLKASNGVSCTTVSLIAAALGVSDITKLTDADRTAIQRLHLLLVEFLALQPGVFAISGWDLVGALTLPAASVQNLLADGDTRWINRGAYDLMGRDPTVQASASGLPRATALYGPIPDQLRRPDSFASQLKALLKIREKARISQAEQVELPEVKSPGLVVMVHRLPDELGFEVTAINFGRSHVSERIKLHAVTKGTPVDLLTNAVAKPIDPDGNLLVELGPFSGQALLIR